MSGAGEDTMSLSAARAAATKMCRRCLQRKDRRYFGPAKQNLDGRQSYCRECAAAYARERRNAKAKAKR